MAGLYSCWRRVSLAFSPWRMAAMGKEQSWLSLWHLEELGSVIRLSLRTCVSTTFLNQAHIPLQTAVIRSAGYAAHDSCTATARSDNVFFATISHQFAGLQRMPGRCSSNVATELAGLAVTVTLSRSGCRFPLRAAESCAWLFAAVNAHIHCRLQCSAFTAAKSSTLSHQNCTNRDATGASRDDFFFLVSFDLSITTSQTNVS